MSTLLGTNISPPISVYLKMIFLSPFGVTGWFPLMGMASPINMLSLEAAEPGDLSGCQPKNNGKTPQIIPFVHRVLNHYFHHPFWGKNPPIFGWKHPSIPEVDGCSLNPNRSFGPAIVSALRGPSVWVAQMGELELGWWFVVVTTCLFKEIGKWMKSNVWFWWKNDVIPCDNMHASLQYRYHLKLASEIQNLSLKLPLDPLRYQRTCLTRPLHTFIYPAVLKSIPLRTSNCIASWHTTMVTWGIFVNKMYVFCSTSTKKTFLLVKKHVAFNKSFVFFCFVVILTLFFPKKKHPRKSYRSSWLDVCLFVLGLENWGCDNYQSGGMEALWMMFLMRKTLDDRWRTPQDMHEKTTWHERTNPG